MTYATAPQADAIALELGESDFLSVDDTGATLSANGALGASATALTFDTLSPASSLSKFNLLQYGVELAMVTAVAYGLPADGVATLTRGAYQTTAGVIPDNAQLSIRTLKKITLLQTATDDIVNYHKQNLLAGLWFAGSATLAKACTIQAIYLSKYIDARNTAEFIRNVTDGSYSDTVISIKPAAGRVLDPSAKALIDNFLMTVGVSVGEYTRA